MSHLSLAQPCVATYSGRRVNPFDLQPEDIDIRDIAHGLALQNRFAGQTREPISVAQHSVYVARLCASGSLSAGPLQTRQALLHDASEAYLGDITKWVKAMPEMKAYREVEDRAQIAIYRHFGCADVTHERVEWADRIMVRFEGLQGYGPQWGIPHPAYPTLTPEEIALVHSVSSAGRWYFWSWQQAETVFLDEFGVRPFGSRLGVPR